MLVTRDRYLNIFEAGPVFGLQYQKKYNFTYNICIPNIHDGLDVNY